MGGKNDMDKKAGITKCLQRFCVGEQGTRVSGHDLFSVCSNGDQQSFQRRCWTIQGRELFSQSVPRTTSAYAEWMKADGLINKVDTQPLAIWTNWEEWE